MESNCFEAVNTVNSEEAAGILDGASKNPQAELGQPDPELRLILEVKKQLLSAGIVFSHNPLTKYINSKNTYDMLPYVNVSGNGYNLLMYERGVEIFGYRTYDVRAAAYWILLSLFYIAAEKLVSEKNMLQKHTVAIPNAIAGYFEKSDPCYKKWHEDKIDVCNFGEII